MYTSRLRVLILFFYIILCVLLVRIFYMQVVQRDFYRKKSEGQLLKYIRIYPNRGIILDRNKNPLAITRPTYTVFGLTRQMKDKERVVSELSGLLSIPEEVLRHKVFGRQTFVWLKRQVDPDIYKRIQALHLSGVECVREEQRLYPNGRLAAHIMGFVGLDNQGLSGLEYLYDSFLKGSPGRIVVEGDACGNRVISGFKRTLDAACDGGTIITTIDDYIQYVAQKYLHESIVENGAKGGIVIVMDPRNGDVLALGSYPDFDPNNWVESDSGSLKNRVIGDVYEPGSTFKIISIAAVLEEKLARPTDVVYVPDSMELGGRIIKEAHQREAGESNYRSVSQIVEKSLNVGTAMLGMRLGEKRLYSYIQKFGFGTKTGVELPGESRGLLRDVKTWSGGDIGRISFGQGIAATPIQMIAAIGVIANQGQLVKPRIVDHIVYNQDKSIKGIPVVHRGTVVSAKTARMMTEMMVQTVERGTGVIARVPGFWVAGKTGTAQKPGMHGMGYAPGEYIASFTGFFPAYHPQYLILVAIDTPRKSIYGSSVAAPVFRKIASDIVFYKSMKPERRITPNYNLQQHTN